MAFDVRTQLVHLPAMGDCLPEMPWQFLSQRLRKGLDGMYVIRTDEADWAFQVEGETVTYQADVPAYYDTRLRADTENLILLSMGRADVDQALKGGELILAGDPEKDQRFCEILFRTF